MRLTATMAILTLMGAAAGAKDRNERVTVYLSCNAPLDYRVIAPAKDLASRMFAAIGVEIDWRTGYLPPGLAQAIEIEIASRAPTSLRSRTMGSATPYEGVHVQIFWDRINRPPSPYKVLAHVMVHEIAHMLEGVARHSAEGVMKGAWNDEDFGDMGPKPLPFAPQDVVIIHAGLNARNTWTAAAIRPQVIIDPIPNHGR
jgi:hypothetical protein